jgi:CDP-glucose 4,6-dehydratase
VLEPVGGYLVLAQALWSMPEAAAEAWNFGPRDEDARPVQWIVEHLCENWGTGASWVVQQGDHPHEAHFLKLDISKARERLQWAPHWDLLQSLTCIVNWHQAYLGNADMRKICMTQIQQFQSKG